MRSENYKHALSEQKVPFGTQMGAKCLSHRGTLLGCQLEPSWPRFHLEPTPKGFKWHTQIRILEPNVCRTFFLKLIIMSPKGPIIHEMKLSQHHRDNSKKLVLPKFQKFWRFILWVIYLAWKNIGTFSIYLRLDVFIAVLKILCKKYEKWTALCQS